MGKKGEERAQELKLFREALQTLLLLLLLIRRAVKPLTKTENGGGRRGRERERERERDHFNEKRVGFWLSGTACEFLWTSLGGQGFDDL